MKRLADEWVEALRSSTYFHTLKTEERSHDDFWRSVSGYDELMSLSGYPGPVAEHISACIPPESGVIDIGAGTGALTLPLAERAARITALDPSSYHLDILKKKAREIGLTNIRYLRGECRDADPETLQGIEYAVAAYSMIDPDLEGFIRRMISIASSGIFLVYCAGDPDPLTEFSSGPRKRADYTYLSRTLEMMGYDFCVEIFSRDYILPLDIVMKKHMKGGRTEQELCNFLSESDRLIQGDGPDLVKFSAKNAVISVTDYSSDAVN